jgi:hypothetical protein
MLDRKNIHNSAMLKARFAKKRTSKTVDDDKLEMKGKKRGLRKRRLHDHRRRSDIS